MDDYSPWLVDKVLTTLSLDTRKCEINANAPSRKHKFNFSHQPVRPSIHPLTLQQMKCSSGSQRETQRSDFPIGDENWDHHSLWGIFQIFMGDQFSILGRMNPAFMDHLKPHQSPLMTFASDHFPTL